MRFSGLLTIAGAATLLALASASPAQSDETVNFTLDPMNDSGARAKATLTALDDGSLHVRIKGTGFTPSQPHAQHLHGAAVGHTEYFCPPPSADKDGDGQVATEEGVPMYGLVVVSLTTKGDVSADSTLALDRFPVADADGDLDYERTIPADLIPDAVVAHLDHLHIVQHGLDVNGNDKYDLKVLGESVFAELLGVNGVPEEGTNPATCGEVTPIGSVDTGGGSSDVVEQPMLFAAGGLALLTAAGVFWLRRRWAPTD
jgi:hypothetical protein